MGEIFKFEQPGEALPFTGERFTSAATGQIEVEHLHRYLQARDACRGRDVLDIASGEGYGSALLAQVARSVIGVEIDPAVVSHASRTYGRDNLSFMAGDARRIRLPDDAFDVVTSFETIEHFYEHDLFLREIRRVLRPGGVLIISTPDRDIYSPLGEPANRYHVHELSKDEFCGALRKEFAHVALFRQRTLAGSVLILDDSPGGEADGAFTTYEKRDHAYLERSHGLPRAKYIVAYASDEPLSGKLSSASAYIETGQIDQASAELAAARQELASAQAALLEWNSNEQRWRSDITSIAGDLEAARQLLAQQDGALAGLRTEGQRARDDNAAMAAALEQARAAVQQAEAGLDRQSASLRSAEERAAVLLGQDAAARQELAELRERIRQLDQALAATRETEAQLRRDHEAAARDADAAREAAAHHGDALAAAQQAAKADAESARVRSAFVDRFLGWRKSYPKPLSFGIKRSINGARRFKRRKSWGAAEARYRKVLSDNPRLPRVWVQYAHAVKEQGDLWAAYGAYSHAVHLDPKVADTYVHLGHVQKQLGMTDEAAATLQRALQLRPSLSNVWQDLRDLGRDDDQLAAAVLSVNEAAVSENSGLGLRFKLARRRARAAARQRDWKLAADHYRKVLALAPNHAHSWLMFGHALKESGDFVAASTAYLQALVLDPVNQEPRRHFDAVWQAARARCAPPALAHEQARARQSGVFALRPGQHLQSLEGGEFLSTGQDPQFALDDVAASPEQIAQMPSRRLLSVTNPKTTSENRIC